MVTSPPHHLEQHRSACRNNCKHYSLTYMYPLKIKHFVTSRSHGSHKIVTKINLTKEYISFYIFIYIKFWYSSNNNYLWLQVFYFLGYHWVWCSGESNQTFRKYTSPNTKPSLIRQQAETPSTSELCLLVRISNGTQIILRFSSPSSVLSD